MQVFSRSPLTDSNRRPPPGLRVSAGAALLRVLPRRATLVRPARVRRRLEGEHARERRPVAAACVSNERSSSAGTASHRAHIPDHRREGVGSLDDAQRDRVLMGTRWIRGRGGEARARAGRRTRLHDDRDRARAGRVHAQRRPAADRHLAQALHRSRPTAAARVHVLVDFVPDAPTYEFLTLSRSSPRTGACR
jgi:hypothetical protein